MKTMDGWVTTQPTKLDWDLIRELIPDALDQAKLIRSFAGMVLPERQIDPQTTRTIEAVRAESQKKAEALAMPPATFLKHPQPPPNGDQSPSE